ncbi:MAG: hypothetical protein JMN27_18360 [gamma proteobacterium endosymbiont of Lamellibrachia anaximandri]|nr:hypothetical protein [gamma proteobacterium endosymbiont of Lamellibrachia anaximandri]MBL3535769.1 hypothetical protein [gamma proteobacterium endosymbiont of Lamellibrachia anaximandri]
MSSYPKEMAEYFFFQGEGSNAVDAGNNEGNLAKSIRDILGFKVAESLLSTLKKKITETRKQIAAQDHSGASTKLEKLIERDESNLAQRESALRDATDRIPSLEAELERVEDKLQRISNQDLQQLRRDEYAADQRMKSLRIEKANLHKRKYACIEQYGWSVFGREFADASLEFIDESQLKGRIPEPYNKTFIEDIISEKECICGAHLEPGSPGFKRIMLMLQKAANPQLVQRLSGIRAQIQDISTLCSVAGDSIENVVSQYDRNDQEMQELSLRLKNLDEQISAIPEDEIQKLQAMKNNLKRDLGNQQQMKGGAEVQITSLNNSIKFNTRKLKALATNSDLVTALNIRTEFLTELHTFLHDYLEKMENSIRMHVLTEVNNTLKKFSRHDFHIKVSKDDFRFFLKDKDDNNVGQGDGLNLLLNLTITASLINYAAERKNVNDAILNSATVAPLVIDAPFGVLDKKYRNVVVKQLPQHANQVIFFVSSSQWTPEMDSEVRGLIGSEYCLILEESAEQGEKIPDTVEIDEREYVTSRYGCDIDRTIVEEISVCH